MDGLKGLVTSQLLGAAAKQFGENESGISSAISGLAATVMHGLADKSDDANAFGGLFDSLSGNKTDGFLDDLGGLLGGGNLAQGCLLYTSPSPRDQRGSRMPSSA